MYSVVLMMALQTSAATPAGLFHNHGHCGCNCASACAGCNSCGSCGGHSWFRHGGHGCNGCSCGHSHKLFSGHHGCCGCSTSHGCCGGHSFKLFSHHNKCGCNGCDSCNGCCGGHHFKLFGHRHHCGCNGCASNGCNGCCGGTVVEPAKGGGAKPPVVNSAKLIITVPAEAKLTVDDVVTSATSNVREFNTPALEVGQDYTYTLKAEIVRDGKTLSVNKVVTVRANEETRTSLEFPVAETAAK